MDSAIREVAVLRPIFVGCIISLICLSGCIEKRTGGLDAEIEGDCNDCSTEDCGATCDSEEVLCYFDDDFSDPPLAPWVNQTTLSGFTATVEVDQGELKLVRGAGDAVARVIFDQATSPTVGIQWSFDIRLYAPAPGFTACNPGGEPEEGGNSCCAEGFDGPCSRVVCSLLFSEEVSGDPVAAYSVIVQSAEWAEHGYFFRGGEESEDMWFMKAEPGWDSHHFEIGRSGEGQWTIELDGMSQATFDNADYSQFVGIDCNGSQSTNPGHGGFIDNVTVCPVGD